jgi:hypothetical protein
MCYNKKKQDKFLVGKNVKGIKCPLGGRGFQRGGGGVSLNYATKLRAIV